MRKVLFVTDFNFGKVWTAIGVFGFFISVFSTVQEIRS